MKWLNGIFYLVIALMETFNKVSLPMDSINFVVFNEVIFDEVIIPLCREWKTQSFVKFIHLKRRQKFALEIEARSRECIVEHTFENVSQ